MGLIGPWNDDTLGPQGLGTLILENAINLLAERNTVLKSLTIVLKRVGHRSGMQWDPDDWDPDPSTLLSALDAERRISTAVGKLANLGRLDIWKVRFHRGSKLVEAPIDWMPVQPEALNRVKADHFSKAKAVLYRRRIKSEHLWNGTCIYLAERFMVDFQQTGAKDRNLEYPREIERLGVDDGICGDDDYTTVYDHND